MTFPHSAAIQRSVKIGTKYTYAALGTSDCFLQPLDAQSSQAYGITFDKSSQCFFPPGTDITKADRVTINGTEYGVQGVKTYNFGSLPHLKAILEEV